jgi:hypothetical protein
MDTHGSKISFFRFELLLNQESRIAQQKIIDYQESINNITSHAIANATE